MLGRPSFSTLFCDSIFNGVSSVLLVTQNGCSCHERKSKKGQNQMQMLFVKHLLFQTPPSVIMFAADKYLSLVRNEETWLMLRQECSKLKKKTAERRQL